MMPLPGFQKPRPYFAVDVEGEVQVDVGAGLGLDEVVAVHGGRDRDLG